MSTQEMLSDAAIYQAQRSALGLIPDNDHHQQRLKSMLEPREAAMSLEERRIVQEVRREFFEQQEFERRMELAYKCSKLPCLG